MVHTRSNNRGELEKGKKEEKCTSPRAKEEEEEKMGNGKGKCEIIRLKLHR